ncbi:THAP domain-containing protein 5 [Frankliniella fusca]|uniref:THAP domain-containing protein 5 n=1 Tax=Frankliniella fusca TaxID=407009 RepID=A0AAE1GUJ6_9NEOP|nr:THAP domain-containing protein 5 [Frankliniella fusca]
MQQFNNSVTIISTEEIFCGSPTSEETMQIDGTSYSDNSSFCFQDVNTNKFIHSLNPPDTGKANILPVKKREKKRDNRKCSAKECQSARVSLFSFPPIMKNELVIEENLIRCKQWVQNTGNNKLLEIPSHDLYKKHWLCSDHFEEEQFHSKMKKRLKPDAIPTLFTSLPLTTEKMLLFPVRGIRNLHTETYQDNDHDVDVNGNNLDAYQKQFEQAMLSFEWRSCNKCKA